MTRKALLFLALLISVILLVIGIMIVSAPRPSSEQTSEQPEQNNAGKSDNNTNNSGGKPSTNSVSWQFNGTEWTANTTPPKCTEPLEIDLFADIDLVTGVLYPGQTRGGDYKPHGGLRFVVSQNNAVDIFAPLDASVIEGSRYIESGEVQYLFTFINDCGIMYRFDHLLTLTPAFQELADLLPAAQPDDSRTTRFDRPIKVSAGEKIATAVGHTSISNVAVDFGLYDLREENEISRNPTWANQHADEWSQAAYAVCWLNNLSFVQKTKLENLPVTNQEGTVSDYCD